MSLMGRSDGMVFCPICGRQWDRDEDVSVGDRCPGEGCLSKQEAVENEPLYDLMAVACRAMNMEFKPCGKDPSNDTIVELLQKSPDGNYTGPTGYDISRAGGNLYVGVTETFGGTREVPPDVEYTELAEYPDTVTGRKSAVVFLFQEYVRVTVLSLLEDHLLWGEHRDYYRP